MVCTIMPIDLEPLVFKEFVALSTTSTVQKTHMKHCWTFLKSRFKCCGVGCFLLHCTVHYFLSVATYINSTNFLFCSIFLSMVYSVAHHHQQKHALLSWWWWCKQLYRGLVAKRQVNSQLVLAKKTLCFINRPYLSSHDRSARYLRENTLAWFVGRPWRYKRKTSTHCNEWQGG